MSLTRIVPAAVPSLFHSSTQPARSNALKNRVPFTLTSSSMKIPAKGIGNVPASVPSLRQRPSNEPLRAVKNSVPLATVKLPGYELRGPGTMSLTSVVPAAVPSVFHSSAPCSRSSWGTKNSSPPTRVRLTGAESCVATLMSLTR
jgi:hypothetical protein